jgi:CDGSH-type Zn-finger protein
MTRFVIYAMSKIKEEITAQDVQEDKALDEELRVSLSIWLCHCGTSMQY